MRAKFNNLEDFEEAVNRYNIENEKLSEPKQLTKIFMDLDYQPQQIKHEKTEKEEEKIITRMEVYIKITSTDDLIYFLYYKLIYSIELNGEKDIITMNTEVQKKYDEIIAEFHKMLPDIRLISGIMEKG